MTPGGSRCSASPPEVTVPEVTSTLTSRARMRSISGSTLINSPMLAPCSQTSGPGGRAVTLTPRRSGTRRPCSLPWRSRRARNSGVNGVIATENSR